MTKQGILDCLIGRRHGYSRKELEKMTKAQLQELLDDITDDTHNPDDE